MANETRADLLEELAKYASPGLVADSDRLCTDAQIRQSIEDAKAQLQYYTDAGFEDMCRAKG